PNGVPDGRRFGSRLAVPNRQCVAHPAATRSLGLDRVELLLRDLPVARHVRMVDVAELVLTVHEPAVLVAARNVAFQMAVDADHEPDERDHRGEFDPAVGHDLRLAPECQCEDHEASGSVGWTSRASTAGRRTPAPARAPRRRRSYLAEAA